MDISYLLYNVIFIDSIKPKVIIIIVVVYKIYNGLVVPLHAYHLIFDHIVTD